MFNDSGNKIKNYSKYCFWIITISSLIFAFMTAFKKQSVCSYYSCKEQITVDWTILIIFVLIIPSSAYISSLFMIGFGDLIQNISSIKKMLAQNIRSSNQSSSSIESLDKSNKE